MAIPMLNLPTQLPHTISSSQILENFVYFGSQMFAKDWEATHLSQREARAMLSLAICDIQRLLSFFCSHISSLEQLIQDTEAYLKFQRSFFFFLPKKNFFWGLVVLQS